MTSRLINESVQQRVEDLLSRMNLDQKIGQMTQAERMAVSPDDVRDYHLGSVLSGGGSCPGDNLPADWVAMNNDYWAASVIEDDQHLPIPVLYAVDAIHGHNNVRGATIFPHNIGLGATNDPDLVRRIGATTAREILATGVEWTFAPTLAVAQDIHWGRTYESYSENADIVASYAGAFVEGLQGDLGTDSVIACAKHFVADGGTTNGIDQGEATLTRAELVNTHAKPYPPAINADVLTIMASFNSWNGNKCHGHKELLTDLLKDELQFKGMVISDWDGIDYLSEDYSDAVALGVNAGIDMFMVSESWKEFIAYLKQHVQRGNVPLERIDDAVRRILSVKFAFGLFEKPSPANRSWSNDESFGAADHRALAREAVRKSLVLLKNKASVLPLDKDARILVAGKNANDRGHQCGGFTIAWQGQSGNEVIEGGTSIWEGITQLAPNAVLSKDGSGSDADAGRHDVAIVVIGERPYAEGMGDIRPGEHVIVEAGSQINGIMNVLEPYGNTLELAGLHPEDLQTILNISSKGIPVAVVLVSGRPLLVNPELAAADAFVAAWLPGSEGQGVADVLFGDFDFQGRLSFSWPKTERQYDKAAAIIPAPLFPLGYGLTYAEDEPKRSTA
jgi:beta-glucosidase